MSITKNYQSAKGTYKVTFNFLKSSAPEAKSVVLLGDFNNWDINSAPKMKVGKEAFSTSLELKAGTYEFRYFIDQIKWENDPSADNFVSSPFVGIHNSVINLPPVADKKVVKTTPAKVAVKATSAKAAKPEVKKVVTPTPAKVTAKATPVKVAPVKPEAKKVATPTSTKVTAKATPVKVATAKPVATKVETAKPATPKVEAPKKVVKAKTSK